MPERPDDIQTPIGKPSSFPNTAPSSYRGSKILAGLFFILATVAVVALAAYLQYPKAGTVLQQDRVFFADPDDYLRTYRAKLLIEDSVLRVGHMPEINAPGGCELHWTAPMDYLVAGIGNACTTWISHPDPFGFAAAYLSFGLGVAYIVCMMGGIRRGFGWGAGLFVGLMIVLSPAFHRTFQLGHPDHHALIELLSLMAVIAWIPRRRSDGEPGTPSFAAALISGFAVGLAIWTASQSMLVWFAILVGLSYACLRGSDRSRQRYIELRLTWNITVILVVACGFLFENWPDLSVIAIDKISLLHVAAVAIAFLAPQRRRIRYSAGDGDEAYDSNGEHNSDGERRPIAGCLPGASQPETTRLILLLFAIAVFSVWLGTSHHTALQHVSRPEVHRWHEYIQELQPLYSQTATELSLQRLHTHLACMPYVLPLMLGFFLFSKRVTPTMKCILGLLAPTFMMAAILQTRWLDHVNLAAVPVIVLGMQEAARRLPQQIGGRSRLVRFLAVAVALAVVMYSAGEPLVRSRLAVREGASPQVDLVLKRADFVGLRINEYEAESSHSNPDRRAILASEGDGPMLLYDTGLPIIAVPYHRAVDGIVNIARFYSETDPLKAREMLDDLGVRFIVIPLRAHEQLMNLEYIAFGEFRSYDQPELSMDAMGRVSQELHYRPRVAGTMAYRLFMERSEVIPGVERIADIMEGAPTPDGWSGLLYVVHDLPITKPTTCLSAPQ